MKSLLSDIGVGLARRRFATRIPTDGEKPLSKKHLGRRSRVPSHSGHRNRHQWEDRVVLEAAHLLNGSRIESHLDRPRSLRLISDGKFIAPDRCEPGGAGHQRLCRQFHVLPELRAEKWCVAVTLALRTFRAMLPPPKRTVALTSQSIAEACCVLSLAETPFPFAFAATPADRRLAAQSSGCAISTC